MFIVIITMTGIIVYTALTLAILPLAEIYHTNHSQIISRDISAIQRAVNEYANSDLRDFYENGYAYPSLETGARMSVADKEFRHLYFNNIQRYQHIETKFRFYNSANPNDSVYSRRFAVWFESPFGNFLGKDNYTKADFNSCVTNSDRDSETGGFDEAQKWCGDPKSMWAKLEAHDAHYSLIQAEQHRLYRLSRKFYSYYSGKQSFEGFPVAYFKASLASLLDDGPVVSAESCTSKQSYKGIPLDCQDLFNAWGEPIYLHVRGKDHIVLTNSLGIERIPPEGVKNKYVGLAEEINIGEILESQ